MGFARIFATLILLSVPVLAPSMAAAEAPSRSDGPSAGDVSAPRVAQRKIKAPKRGQEVLLTVSGGVSLGAYEAGLLYFMGETFKRVTKDRRLKLATGASAGSVNGFITALNSCRPSVLDPREDLGYQLWTKLGMKQLYVPGRVTATALFDGDALIHAAAPVMDAWSAGVAEGCDVVFGASVTRKHARPLENRAGLDLERETEQFVVRIKGSSGGTAPTVENYIDPDRGIARPRLPLDPLRPEQNFVQVRGLMMASAAFPVGFPSRRLRYCLADPEAPPQAHCSVGETEDASFVDGGVFDNSPLRLAYDVATHGLRSDPSGRLAWRDPMKPDKGRGVLSAEIAAVYVNPDRTVFPSPRDDDEHTNTLIAELTAFMGNFVTSARTRELVALIEEHPDVGPRLHATARRYPTISGHLSAFFGFFETDFRIFDYYLGMYDGYREFLVDDRRRDLSRRERNHTLIKPGEVAPELVAFFGKDPATIAEGWRPLACMISVYDDVESLREACDGPALNNFRILLQVSIDRIYDICSRTMDYDRPDSTQHFHCAQASDDKATPLFFPAKSNDEGTPHETLEGESPFAHTMRLLAKYGFHFRDLGLDVGEASRGTLYVRRQLLEVLEESARQQPGFDRAIMLTGSRMLVNQLAYEPPPSWFYAAVGTHLEFGYSFRVAKDVPWFRLSAATAVGGLLERIASKNAPINLAVAVGPEFTLLPISSTSVQTMLGVRAAYKFSSTDSFHGDKCTALNSFGDARTCSQVVINSYLAFALLERFRFQLSVNFFPVSHAWDSSWADFDLSFGFHFF